MLPKETKEYRSLPDSLKTDKLPQNLVIIKNTKFLDFVTKQLLVP
jgi:hypothetical protein